VHDDVIVEVNGLDQKAGRAEGAEARDRADHAIG
jgi:hypothetical protein